MKARTPLNDEQLRILQRIARLRAVTVPQAHALVEGLAGSSVRNVYARFARLARDGFLAMDLVWPSRGRYSPFYYRLASAGLRVIRRQRERHLLARPSQPILEYLLFRNEVYAAARRGGWLIASPLLTRADLHASALETFRSWALAAKEREADVLRAAGRPPAEIARVAEERERLPRFLPTSLKFEYLFKRGAAGRATDVVLLVIDDPRRPVRRTSGRGQAAALPHVDPERVLQIGGRELVLPGLKLLLRDCQSRYDLARREVFQPSPRLRAWRRALAAHYGQEFLATDVLFPDLWAHRVGAPAPNEPALTETA